MNFTYTSPSLIYAAITLWKSKNRKYIWRWTSAFNGPVVHLKKTLNVCAWGTKYHHVQYQIFSIQFVADCYKNCIFLYSNSSWIHWGARRNNYKVRFVEIFEMFQRHCFRRFPRDVQLQRLRDGPRHLLVISLMMQATIRRGGDFVGRSWSGDASIASRVLRADQLNKYA